MDLPERALFKVWEYSVEEINNSIKQPREDNNIYMARVWSQGLFKALKSLGFDICISKDGKEVWSSKPL